MASNILSLNGDRDLGRAFRKQVDQDLAAEEKRLAAAYTAAARAVGKRYQGELRADFLASGFQNASALAKTWRLTVYPPGRNALSPAIYIRSAAPLIVQAFSYGGTITAQGKTWFSIPTAAATAILGSAARSRDGGGRFKAEEAKVARVAAALGVPRLRFIPMRKGGFVLVDPRNPQGAVYFVLVRGFSPGKRLKGMDLLRSFNDRFAADFAAELASRL